METVLNPVFESQVRYDWPQQLGPGIPHLGLKNWGLDLNLKYDDPKLFWHEEHIIIDPEVPLTAGQVWGTNSAAKTEEFREEKVSSAPPSFHRKGNH